MQNLNDDENKKEKKDEETKLLEEALTKIVSFLKTKKIKLSKIATDERTNSSKNEEEVVDAIVSFSIANEWMIKNNLKIGTPNLTSDNNREWYDFSIESNDTSKNNYFMPVNIKVTQLDGGAADNLNCKLGIFYALTGCLPSSVNIKNGISWPKYFELMDEKMATNKNKDYYFLVVDKNDSSNVFFSSLKTLNTISPNGNNLPFQCKWCENKTRVERNYKDARNFILDCFRISIEKRDTTGQAFKKHMTKYIDFSKKDEEQKETNTK